MTLRNIKSASPDEMKKAFEADHDPTHIHHQVIDICEMQIVVGAITYPVIDLCRLQATQHAKIAGFLVDAFDEAGVRPDTPFHNNDEQRYTVDAVNWDRYLELNTIGGGMRLIHDRISSSLFLSCHYSHPAVVTANGCVEFGGKLLTVKAKIDRTHKAIIKHSDGTLRNWLDNAGGRYEERRKYLELKSRESPQFVAWLRNKNAGQNKEVVKELYNLEI